MKIIASHNGLTAAACVWQALGAGGLPLDSCVAAATMVEDDPEELTVGYGGLPNEDGAVELDAAVMDGRTHRGGAVAALRNIRHPTQVARLVMQLTNRVLLAGDGALRFARANGFPEENLLTEQARRMWLYWKQIRSPHDDWRTPADAELDPKIQRWFQKNLFGLSGPEGSPLPHDAADVERGDMTGTVHFAAIDQHGDLACATSTSGHAFKIAGRVGDSPVLGAGLYVDNEIGSCGSTGHGESNLENLTSFAAVELMRGGRSPREAGLEILRRIVARARPDQFDAQGRPTFNVNLFLLAKDGSHAGVSLQGGKQIAVVDADGARLEDCTPLLAEDKSAAGR